MKAAGKSMIAEEFVNSIPRGTSWNTPMAVVFSDGSSADIAEVEFNGGRIDIVVDQSSDNAWIQEAQGLLDTLQPGTMTKAAMLEAISDFMGKEQ